MTENATGRIDVHSHLLPGIDDGCQTLADSLACARRMVQAGYTHSFCTPHVWPNFPENNAKIIPQKVAALQEKLDEADIPLRLIPGGEIGLRPEVARLPFEQLVTFGMQNRYCLVDIWADHLPAFFEKAVKHLQSFGLKVILAHPERMRAVQDDPGLIDHFQQLGLLLQGNLQCFDDPPDWLTRQIVERNLIEGRYFLLGSDLHNPETLDCRLRGLDRALDLVGPEAVQTLTHHNPRQLLPADSL